MARRKKAARKKAVRRTRRKVARRRRRTVRVVRRKVARRKRAMRRKVARKKRAVRRSVRRKKRVVRRTIRERKRINKKRIQAAAKKRRPKRPKRITITKSEASPDDPHFGKGRKVYWHSADKDYRLYFLSGWPFEESPDASPDVITVPANGNSRTFKALGGKGTFDYEIRPPADDDTKPNPVIILDGP